MTNKCEPTPILTAERWLFRRRAPKREGEMFQGDCTVCGAHAGERHEPTDVCGIIAGLLEAIAVRDELWCEHDAPFHEWAQGYLDSARWAGHGRLDAIKTELLERDAALLDERKARQAAEAHAREAYLELRDVHAALAAALGTYLDRSVWIVAHVDRGHGIVRHDHYDQCSCGATFHRSSPTARAVDPAGQEQE